MRWLSREEGAAWMALGCWAVGWAAARTWAWEPLVIALAAVGLIRAAEALKRRRPPILGPAALVLAVPLLAERTDETSFAALALPSILTAGLLVARLERLAASRLVATAAITSLAPAAYIAAAGRFDATAALLWLSLGGYFALASLFVMARLRRSRALLWAVRLLGPSIFALAVLCPSPRFAHAILGSVFLVLSLRAWTYRATAARIDPRRVGRLELGFSTATALLVLAAAWLS
jgi:hypothetical protein